MKPIRRKDDGGYGFADWGDPWGVGGPLKVARALAVEGQTVRVVFDEPPLARSRTSTDDALNPLNYQVDIIDGSGTKPQVVGVKKALVPAPAAAVYTAPETGVDVQTDRQLVIGVYYRVTVVNVVAAAGGALGTPDSANFSGIVKIGNVTPPLRNTEFSDFRFDSFSDTSSGFVFNDAGDIDVDRGVRNIRKRVVRRVTTPKNSFRHLPGYGTLLGNLKRPMSVRELAPFKQDILQQILQEPDVLEASVGLTFQSGVLTIAIKARTPKGIIDETVRSDGEGIVVR